ncbi:MAG TPA: hypothetical protein VJI98_05215 [Candidatus Nanoarchaeia archaeon]|nr:hypothetical protein [Candidatus Nanoarchaeia archaeon]
MHTSCLRESCFRVKLFRQLSSKKPPTTGDRLRAQHQWHARFARSGFSTMIFPIKEMATPPVKIHWWKNHILRNIN